MDDTRKTIINRLLAMLTQININTVQFKQKDQKDAADLSKAYEFLRQSIASMRLDIKDAMDVWSMNAIELDLRQHPNLKNLVVAIDGLFNVDVAEEKDSIRETNIERAIGLKMLTQEFMLPVLATAEIRKAVAGAKKTERTIHDIMESGKFGYNADVVWIMETIDPEAAKDQSVIEVKLKFEKNKLSDYKKNTKLSFYKAKSTFREI